MGGDTEQMRLVALVFTDIAGSTQLKQVLGDTRSLGMIRAHHVRVRQLVGGFEEALEINTAGDSFLLKFSRPSDAVRFALALQAGLRATPCEAGLRVRDRVGIHVGEVVVDQAADPRHPWDLHGMHVDLAARVMSLAEPDQILLTRIAFDSARQALRGEDLPGIGELRWLHHGLYRLKGIEEPVEICEVGETGLAPLRAPADAEKAQREIVTGEEAVLGWRPAVGQSVPRTPWVLERKLADGGFGEVWLGRHTTLKDRRVFKFCFRADRVRSLKREMTLFRLLRERMGEHPHIVALRDVFFDEAPYYVAMDYVAGEDLARWCDSKGGASQVPLATRLELVAQVADALQAAHDAGVVHRDIKPGNILVCDPVSAPGGAPVAKLTDFGIGQILSNEVLAGITMTGFTQTVSSGTGSTKTGTLLYLAPEALAGEPCTPGSDLYALGVVLHQLVLGDFRKPLTSDWPQGFPDPLLREDVQRCVAGNPRDRFASAAELARSLRSLAERRQRRAEQEAEQAARERAAYRRGWLAAGIVMLVLALALLAFHHSRLARAAERSEKQQRLYVEKLRQEDRDRLGRSRVAYGNRLALDNDLTGALLWYVAALGNGVRSTDR